MANEIRTNVATYKEHINGDYNLQTDSPCIDAGIADLNSDGIDDITDFMGTAPDMGAFELYPTLTGDINADGEVNVVDVILVVNMILEELIIQDSADINQDGLINVVDIIQLVQIILGN